jgi:glucose-1-phosphate thymidylyltransferase
MKCEKGIILAGGNGTRLYPLNVATSKQLLPVYDKPAVYYPLTTLMLAGIKNILIISTPRDIVNIKELFGTGEQFGMKFEYADQEQPTGLPEAFVIGEKFIGNQPVAMILGDNFFHGHGLSQKVYEAAQNIIGGHLFLYLVDNPSRYGIAIIDDNQKIIEVTEKPSKPKSKLAITGLYFFDGSVAEKAKKLQKSARGETEIVDLINTYLKERNLNYSLLGRGYVWFDIGMPKSLLDASNYVEVIQSRQGVYIASIEEVAFRMKFIDKNQLNNIINKLPFGDYREYLESLLI